ncbi:Scytalone dehydratase-like Arp1-like protein [Cladobotryum mycophilum]|uniref:Scytalone dehydratase-like Arp1-like protein n=1 Tax=Cladobotryum mycophilum TaxID=491253 RepID=A0ABR0ST11_9HYPO
MPTTWAQCFPWPRLPRAYPIKETASIQIESDPERVQVDSILDSTGCLFSVSGIRYIAPISQVTPRLKNRTLPKTGLGLATVFSIPPGSQRITTEWVEECLDIYNDDDVFNQEFLANVVFHGSGERRIEITNEALEFLERRGMKTYTINWTPGCLPGPHVVVDRELREVWRLVDDSNGTCLVTLKPQQDPLRALEPFPITSQDDQALSFAIPSRIRSSAHTSPLAGLRILVKDNIHLKGIKTSAGNRAFYETYPPQDQSADCIQKLMDKGVVVVGKTKLNSFGNWEEPTEYIDYQAPWNPRADGYQSTGGSSSGSASAIVSYDWLDIAIGTDTWGSVTRPAHWCGCFALRPSIGTISANGIEPYVQSWDIPGILARDLRKCRTFAAEWLTFDKFEKMPESFSSVIWPTDFWKIIDPEQAEIARSFAKNVAAKLMVKFEEISFEARWRASPPTKGVSSLPRFIDPATTALAYDVYHNSEDFRKRYWDLFQRAPYTTRPNERLWDVGKTITKEERDAGFEKINFYSAWFRDTVMIGEHANAITVLPLENTGPRYRDEYPEFKRPPQDGINALALAPVLHSPLLTVPIAEISYTSRITKVTEKLPFTVALMGTPGTDLQLLDTAIQILPALNIPTTVQTGRSMYDVSKPHQAVEPARMDSSRRKAQ